MHSPIARGLFALGRLCEWGHRRIHGPEFAPGDVVEVKGYDPPWRPTIAEVGAYGRVLMENGSSVDAEKIVRVVRYGEGGV